MDSFISLAKQGIQAYENAHQAHSGGDGDQVQDRRHHEAQGVPHLDHDEVVDQAHGHAGDSGNKDLFAGAMKFVAQNHGEHTQTLQEEQVVNSHKEAYEHNNAKNLDSGSLGAAAAMQAFKMFAAAKSGGGGSSSGGGGSAQLVSLAMSEGAKLFESCGGKAPGGKQACVNNAAMTMMKLVVQSKLGQHGVVGGGDSGGLGSLMSIAGKFL